MARMAFNLRTILYYLILGMASAFFLFPIVWMGGTSLKTIEEVGQAQLSLFPTSPQWGNYAKLFGEDAFYRAFGNSVFVTGWC